MSAHTLGPWRANRLATYAEPGWVVLWPDTSKPGTHHRRLDYQGNFIEADARLIAAAPDMFEALEAIEFALRQGMPAAMVLDENSPIRDCLRAAIAKATGSAA